MLLDRLEMSRKSSEIALFSFLIGIVFLGYDFMVFFGGAAIGILLIRKRYVQIPIACMGMSIPTVAWGGMLKYYYGGSYISGN